MALLGGPKPPERVSDEWAGRVVFVTGLARGQGRCHALKFASLGADIGGVDICRSIDSVPYPLASREDLDDTAAAIRGLGRRAVVTVGDVRQREDLASAVSKVVEQLGRIDVVVANAGIFSVADTAEMSSSTWTDVIETNLGGVFNTVQACLPTMIAGGRGGSIIVTSSIGGLQGLLGCAHYVASKHGVIGLMRALANELGQYSIRVNAVCPTNVDTIMIQNEANYRTFRPDLECPVEADIIEPARAMHLLPIPWVDPEDVAAAVSWLASDAARFVTGTAFPIDAGATAKVQN
ncbi:MAG: mycofactocin-coupled SDR family oxidoreductase [Acidimicrobiales bacterium]